MSRDLTTEVSAAIGERVIKAALLAKFEFDGGDILFWSGKGPLTYNGETYEGVGGLIGISEYDETEDLTANGMTFQLTGIPESLISVAYNQEYRRRRCSLAFAIRKGDVADLFDADTSIAFDADTPLLFSSGGLNQLEDTPYQWFVGLMNVMKINRSRNTCTITLQAENEMILLKQAKVRRYTPEDQKALYPADTCFDLIATMQDKVLPWGSSQSQQ